MPRGAEPESCLRSRATAWGRAAKCQVNGLRKTTYQSSQTSFLVSLFRLYSFLISSIKSRVYFTYSIYRFSICFHGLCHFYFFFFSSFLADDEMIDHLDLEEFASLDEMIGEVLVFDGWHHIPAGMVMDHDNLNGQLVDRHAEGFSGLDVHHVGGAQSDQLDIEYLVCLIQTHHPKVFLSLPDFVLSAENLAHDRIDVLRTLYGDFLLLI